MTMGQQAADRAGPDTVPEAGATPDQPSRQPRQRDATTGPPATAEGAPGNDALGNETGKDSGPDPLVEARAQVAELTDRWRRIAAELDNFRKRSARESAQQRTDEQARVLSVWLPVVDNLELALEHAGSEPDGFVDGIRSIRDQALAVVDGFGYPRMDDLGAQFDPKLHEALGTVPDADHQPGTVVHVVRPRYGQKDRVLRPAAVIVAAEQH
jgi:molecular chaperone GrpE